MKTVAIFRSHLLGHSETFIRDQSRALHEWRPVLVGNCRVPNGLPLNGLDVRLLPHRGSNILSRLSSSLSYWLARPCPRSVVALHGMGFSLIHAHFGTDAVVLWPTVKALGLPMLVTLHGYDINTNREWWEAGHGGLRRRVYPRRLLAMARHPHVRFIAVSQAIRERAIAFGIPEAKITVHYIGVDIDKFQPGGLPICQRPKRILFVGRLVEKKGAIYLIRAFAALRARVPEAELVVAGDGPLRAELERLAVELRAPVQFLGAVRHEEVKRQMDQARVFCLPSVSAVNGDAEGLPIVIVEAQSSGVPVVTTLSAGGREAIDHGRTGYAVSERESTDLAHCLTELMLAEDKLTTFSLNARALTIAKFDLARNTKELESIYHEHAEHR